MAAGQVGSEHSFVNSAYDYFNKITSCDLLAQLIKVSDVCKATAP
jgi:hypothetical protein